MVRIGRTPGAQLGRRILTVLVPGAALEAWL
jgi:hypothetical protein